MVIWYTVLEIWRMRCNWYFSFRAIFCPFTPLTCPKNENFKKIKKAPRDITILHKCTKNHDHMLYCPGDMAHDGCNCYFSFWAIFCPFTSLKVQKIKISKKKTKKKKIILHMCTKNSFQCYLSLSV